MLLSYTYRRYEGLVELLIPKHDWAQVIVVDGTTDVGVYSVTVTGVTFQATDPNAGLDSSAAIVADLIAQINASTVPATAYAAAAPVTGGAAFRLRHDNFGGQLNLFVDTTDVDGSIRYRPDPPDTIDVQSAANWDGVFASVQEVSRHHGFVSPTVGRDRERLDALTVNANQMRNYTRIVLNLADIGLTDDVVNFFQYIPQFAGVAVTPLETPIDILLTEKQLLESHTMLTLAGTAPAAASFDDATVLNLPRQTSSYELKNLDGVNDLFVSFGTGTQEVTVAAGETIRNNRLNVSTLTVRGDGAGVPIYITVTLNAQRMLR